MKLRKRLPGSDSSALHLQPALPDPFRKNRLICGRNRRRSRPGKVSRKVFSSMRMRLCRILNPLAPIGERPALNSRKSARSSAAEHPLLPANDKGPRIYSHSNRAHFLRRKRWSREPPSASKLRLSKRKRFVSASRLSPRQNRPPRHEPRAGLSSFESRAARRQCGEQCCGNPKRRTIRWFILAERKLLFKAEPLGNPLTLRFLAFLLPPRRPRAGEAPASAVPERKGPPDGQRKGLLPKEKSPSRHPGPESKTPVRR